ncbi:MAG: FAD-dependent monooxygenase, partial [Pseudomonadota bacterium]
PLDDGFLNRFGFPYAVVHRAEFHRILLDLCRTSDLVSFRLKSKLVAYDQTDRHVEVLLADGTRLRGTALIGADGLHSAVRRQLCGDGAPLVSGKSTYRTLIAADDMPEQLRWNAGVLWAGPKVHAVHYPLSGSRKLNLVANCVDGCTVAHRGSAVDADVVQACFAGMAPELQRLIARGRDWRHWVLCDRAPITRWVDHRVALLGDAAHPMLQYFAQGACMAIEDALILAQSLADHPDDPPAGLDAYQHQRHVRTARVQRMSRSVGDYICHASGGLAAYRDRILARRTPERWHDVLEWI